MTAAAAAAAGGGPKDDVAFPTHPHTSFHPYTHTLHLSTPHKHVLRPPPAIPPFPQTTLPLPASTPVSVLHSHTAIPLTPTQRRMYPLFRRTGEPTLLSPCILLTNSQQSIRMTRKVSSYVFSASTVLAFLQIGNMPASITKRPATIWVWLSSGPERRFVKGYYFYFWLRDDD